MKTSTLQDEDKYILRMPDGMRQQFAEIAKRNGRSLNAELVYRLSQSLLVPEDVVAACNDMGDVTDRLDFAVRLLRRARMNVSIPGDDE